MSTAPKEDDPSGHFLTNPEENLRPLSETKAPGKSPRKSFHTMTLYLSLKA
jgi:hypothetical protein